MSRLFYDTGTGKTDHAVRLGHDDIAERCETGCNTTGSRVGQNRKVGKTGLMVASESTAGFGHLHQAEDPFVHAGTTGSTHDNAATPFLGRHFDGTSQFFTNGSTHTGSKEAEVHHAQRDRVS